MVKTHRLLHNIAVGVALLMVVGGAAFHSAAGYSSADLSGAAWGTDEAYVSFRYSQNMADGHGPVYNRGEKVEGYNSFLYVVIMSVICAAGDGPDAVYPVAVFLNIIFVSVALILFYRFALHRIPGLGSSLSALLFAACPAILVWVGSGLETALVLMLQIAVWSAVELHSREGTRSELAILVLAACLLCLSRSDGFVLPVLAVSYLLARGRKRSALVAGAAVLLTLAVHVGWRWTYYGYPFPNTFYAGLSGGFADYVGFALLQLGQTMIEQRLFVYLAIPVLLIPGLFAGRRDEDSSVFVRMWFPLLMVAGLLVNWLFYGAGGPSPSRALVLLFPVGIYVLMEWLHGLPRRCITMPLAALVLVLVQLSVLATDPRFEFTPAEGKYDRGIKIGQFLRKRYAGATLAVDAAGKIPFYSGLTTIDMRGNNSDCLAHQESAEFKGQEGKCSAEHVLSLRPDVIVAQIGPERDLCCGMDRETYESAGYRVRYLASVSKLSRFWVLEIRGMEGEKLGMMNMKGFSYAIIERVGLFPWSSM